MTYVDGDEERDHRNHVNRMSGLYDEGKIDHRRYIGVLKKHRDVLDEWELEELAKWEDKEAAEIKRISQEKIRKNRIKEKETSNFVSAIWWIFCGVLLVIILIWNAKR